MQNAKKIIQIKLKKKTNKTKEGVGWEKKKKRKKPTKKPPSHRGGRARRERNNPPPKTPGEGIKQTLVPTRPDQERGREKGVKLKRREENGGKKKR